MRRKLGVLVAVSAAVLTLSTGPAGAAPVYPGAGFIVGRLTGMTAQFHVPKVYCASGENSTSIIGVISPAIGQLEGWNATAVVGCASGQPWYRIQTWVNAVGGGHNVYPAAPGDLIKARLLRATSTSPEIRTADLTTNHAVTNRMNQLRSPSTVAAAGIYGGALIPNFDRVYVSAWASGKPLGQMPRLRSNLMRGRTLLVAAGSLWSDSTTFTTAFKHR